MALFVIVTFYALLENILFYISKMRGLKKLDNKYFVLAMTIIFVVVTAGLWAVEQFYINDYTYKISFSDNVNTENPFVCYSQRGALYFLDSDIFTCIGKLNFQDSKKLAEVRLNILKNDEWIKDDKLFSEIENGSLIKFSFSLEEDIERYDLTISLNDSEGKIVHNENENFEFEVLNKYEYNKRIRERIGFASGIILIALFSVFSAIANLKKILSKDS